MLALGGRLRLIVDADVKIKIYEMLAITMVIFKAKIKGQNQLRDLRAVSLLSICIGENDLLINERSIPALTMNRKTNLA